MYKITISKLHVRDLKKFNIFIKKNWVDKVNLLKLKKIFKWQYQNDNFYNFYVAHKLKKIVGVQGFISSKHYDKNLSNDQIFLAFLRVIDGKHIGVGLKLHKQRKA